MKAGAVRGGVVLAAAAATALLVSGPASAATAGAGAGISAWPVCSATPLVPGRGVQLQPGGLGNSGVTVDNPGNSAEALTLSVGPLPSSSPLYGRARPVPASWVTFGYPRRLLVLPGHSVTVGAGASATVPVTVTPPAGTSDGAYAASLAVSTGSGSGGVQLAAGAATLLVFTVGETRPHWPALVMAATGPCWDPPGARVPWQQWAGTPYATPPPGWHWQPGQPGTWAFTPPAGWYESWADPDNPHQIYRGGRPVVACANPAAYPDRQTGGYLIGAAAGYPVTSTAAGCAAWLAASKAGTLGTEPAIGGSPGHADPLPGPAPALASSARPAASTAAARVAGFAVLLFIGAIGLAVRVAMAVRRTRRTARRARRL